MPNYRDPAEAFEEGKFLEGMTDLPKADKKKKKKKKEASACGQGSCTTNGIRDYK